MTNSPWHSTVMESSCAYHDFLDQDDLGVWQAPSGARVAWFKDPDGNLLSLTEVGD